MSEPDFSGWATANDMKCSDGRVIKSGAFKHMDKAKVPLVWQHQHGNAEHVLGHAMLEDRAFGVYCHGFFNDTAQGKHAKQLVKHKDIDSLSIYANNLTEQNKYVLHGDIKEVSLVLAGANPGALIDNINLVHGDMVETIDSEAIIYTGLEITLEHSDTDSEGAVIMTDTTKTEDVVVHADGDDETIADVYESMSEKQQTAVQYLVGQALAKAASDGAAKHDNFDEENFLAHVDDKIKEGFDSIMNHNIFETAGRSTSDADGKATLSHDQLKTIFTEAQREGSLKESVLAHAQDYGIENIDFLFPDAKTLSNTPELLSRRTEWVATVIDGTRHSPISRIKSIVADITADEARAKGYVKGNLKKDEIIKLLKRTTTPVTIYKKQKLDRDDIVDITDLDVVAWLKAEMRLMLDEELARAILIGDGREPDDEDKIDEDHIRPIAYDDDMYAHKVNLASNSSPTDLVEGILRARTYYKGTGTPTLFTTDPILTDMLLDKDKVGRRLYASEAELAAALRVSKIVVVEVMESHADLLAILVSLSDYTVGADKGGAVSMFDDFDIDYNQYKYLIETRASGALTKPKSAVIIKQDTGTTVVASQPAYNPTTHVITIPTVTGVKYYIDDVEKVPGNVTITETTEVEARAQAGYKFAHNTDNDWVYTY